MTTRNTAAHCEWDRKKKKKKKKKGWEKRERENEGVAGGKETSGQEGEREMDKNNRKDAMKN